MGKDLRHVLARAVLDEGFKKRLMTDPLNVAKHGEGVDLPAEVAERIKKMSDSDWKTVEDRMTAEAESSPCP